MHRHIDIDNLTIMDPPTYLEYSSVVAQPDQGCRTVFDFIMHVETVRPRICKALRVKFQNRSNVGIRNKHTKPSLAASVLRVVFVGTFFGI